MRTYKKYVNTVVFIIILFISFNINQNPFSMQNVIPSIEVNQSKNPLYEEIKDRANDDGYIDKPENAYIDRVWKKTPGRNGREINIERSFENMKKSGKYSDELLVYNQTRPEVSLEELPSSPIYRGHPDKQMVAFIINVSWGAEHIPDILETLKEHKVKVSFFIEGKWARENAELVKMIQEQGHLIGNHAYNHPDMTRISNEEIHKQISQTNEILTAIIGEQPRYFAPPSGSFTDQVVEKATELKMETILWTTDTIDWKNPSVSVMINRVNGNIHPGAIVLMHPTQAIVNGLDEMIALIKEKGFRLGRIDNLLSEER